MNRQAPGHAQLPLLGCVRRDHDDSLSLMRGRVSSVHPTSSVVGAMLNVPRPDGRQHRRQHGTHLPTGLSYTTERNARRAVLAVLEKHNSERRINCHRNALSVAATANTVDKARQAESSKPSVSKKALLMKRACLEAESKSSDLHQRPIKKQRLEQDAPLQSKGGGRACDDMKIIPPGTVGLESYAEDDVLCGRGGGTNIHPGNCRFRDLIHANRRAYLMAKKNDKPAISRSIVRKIRESNGRFLKKDECDGLWYEVGDSEAREKTSQALRQRAPEMRRILFGDEQCATAQECAQETPGVVAASSHIEGLMQQRTASYAQCLPYGVKDVFLQLQLGALHPHAAYVQRNAQAWTMETLVGRGINRFTPHKA